MTPAYLPYLMLVENCIVLAFLLSAFCMFARLVYCVRYWKEKLRVRSFSGAFCVYVCTHVFGSLTGIPYIVHIISGWSLYPENYRYNPIFMFYTGTILQCYLTCTAVPVCFLTLDRCLALSCSNVKYQRISEWLVPLSIAIYVANFLVFYAFVLGELPINMERARLCGNITCLETKHKTIPALIQKLTCLAVSLALSLYFLYLLRHKAKLSKVKNRVVKVTVIIEFVLCTIPQCLNLATNLFTDHQISEYLGTYLTTLGCCETAICGLLYSRVFLLRKSHTNATRISAVRSFSFSERP